MHNAPSVPHAVSGAPTLQTPIGSQQPVHVAEQLPPSVVGALQTLIGSVGATASEPQMSPGVLHSAVDTQSWTGPMGVIGHGPDTQAVVVNVAAQHT